MDDDDTPSEWSFHSSNSHQQQQQQQQQRQQQQQPTATTIPMSSSPLVSRTRKAPSASPSPSEPAKRARLDGGVGHHDESTRSCSSGSVVLPGGMDFGSDRGGSCTLKHGKAEEAASRPDGGGGGSGGGCSFRWSKGGNYQRDSQWSGSSGHSAKDSNQQHGGSKAAGLGGGISAAHPSEMDVVVGGDRHEARPNSGYVLKGGGEARNGNGNGEPGGGAVISSGFGAGGFPKHPWHQDQGGSSDDMLILYGSPS